MTDELEGILDFAFERYFEDSGMFGTAEDGIKRAADLKAIGVTEIACLIDYGIDTQTVLQGLRPLTEVRNAANTVTELAADDFSIAAQIVRHDVTHLQCTPSYGPPDVGQPRGPKCIGPRQTPDDRGRRHCPAQWLPNSPALPRPASKTCTAPPKPPSGHQPRPPNRWRASWISACRSPTPSFMFWMMRKTPFPSAFQANCISAAMVSRAAIGAVKP
ncbi:hypothetical protein GQR58_000169 [Nymphon striatum]|nr:hypothetical protein GQR58_000169 [Nymphon striatum]